MFLKIKEAHDKKLTVPPALQVPAEVEMYETIRRIEPNDSMRERDVTTRNFDQEMQDIVEQVESARRNKGGQNKEMSEWWTVT